MIFSVYKRAIGIISDIERMAGMSVIRVYAAYSSFFIIISAIPFLITALNIAGMIIPSLSFDESFFALIPNTVVPIISDIISEARSKSDVSLVSLSGIFLVWSSSKGIRGIGKGIRTVYGAEKTDFWLSGIFKGIVFTLIYLFAIILVMVIWVFGDILFSSAPFWRGFGKFFNGLSLFLILTALFSLTYAGYGERKNGVFSQLPGGAFSSFGWLVYSVFFEIYIENFASYSYLYGSLASMLVLMLWVYSCIKILLLGGRINALIRQRETKHLDTDG